MIQPNDWVSCTNPNHSRYGDCGRVTATQRNAGTTESRVQFSDNHTFWIQDTDLELNHRDSLGIPGDEL